MHLTAALPLLSAVALATTLTIAPVISQQLTGIDIGGTAQAKSDGGNGNGGGSNGNGGGSNGNGGGSNGNGGGNNGNSFGLSHDAPEKADKSANKGLDGNNGLGNDHKSVSAKLGRLNAAHASATARANASPNSAVGLLAQYEKAVYEAREATSEEERAKLEQSAMEILGQAANKEINEEIVTAVNALLGIEPVPETDPESETDTNSEIENDTEETVTEV